MRPLSVAAGLVCAAVVAPLAAQPPVTISDPAGTLSLAGNVVNSVTGEPVRFALVGLSSVPSLSATRLVSRNVLTDASGHFQFTGLPKGKFFLSGSKLGYDSLRTGDTTVALERSRDDVVVRLPPVAILSGRITDTSGEPLAGVSVQVFRSVVRDGRRLNELTTSMTTDDRGEYRVAHLIGGIYIARAAGREAAWMHLMERTPSDYADEAFAPYYFGGDTAESATPIALQPGQQFRADFKLVLAPARRIRGVVRNLVPYIGAQIELLRAGDEVSAARTAINVATGNFEIQEVVDGTYQIRVTQDDGDRRLRAIETVQVAGKNVDGILLSLSAGAPLVGTMRVEGGAPQGFRRTPNLTSADESPFRGRSARTIQSSVGEDGRVRFDAVPPGKYRFDATSWGQMYVASAKVGLHDLLANPEFAVGTASPGEMEIVLRTDGGTVAASVTDGLGLIGILVPESGQRPPMIAGIYEGSVIFWSVPPGVYRLSVWKNGQQLEYRRPDIAQMLLTRGERVEVSPGGTTRLKLAAILEIPE